jgi:hypothetical protein
MDPVTKYQWTRVIASGDTWIIATPIGVVKVEANNRIDSGIKFWVRGDNISVHGLKTIEDAFSYAESCVDNAVRTAELSFAQFSERQGVVTCL